MGNQQMRHYRVRRPEPKPAGEKQKDNLSVRAIRCLGGFLLLMVLFTLLSRAADELTIPRVSLAYPSEGTIDRTLTAYGKVEEMSAQAVTTEPGLRVAGVAVKAGAVVETGDPLFTLDTADIEEKLAEAKDVLARQDMDLSDRASQEELSGQDRARALERASQDYAAAQTSADREVERTAKALEKAKAELNAAPTPMDDRAALESACAQAGEKVKAAEEALARIQQEMEDEIAKARREAEEAGEDPDQREEQVREEYLPALDEASAAAEAAQEEKSKADGALAAYTEAAAHIKALQDSVDMAQENYDRAVESRNNALRSASRQIEDAQRPQAQDSSRKKAEMDRERQAQQVARLEELLSAGGVVRAPGAGTVTGVSLTVGMTTPDGTAVLLAGEANGGIFTAQFSSEQEKYLSPGDEAVIKLGGGRASVEGLVLETVAPNPGDPTLLDVTVRPPEGSLAIGTAAELEVRRRSQEYPCRVPLSALHEDNGAFYLLVVREQAGLLGTQTTAARLDVTVLEKNETMAAIQPGALDRGQGFLAASGKTVSAGDRIRLEVP